MSDRIDDKMLRDDHHLTELRRQTAPDGFGDECPVCNQPFDAGSSGTVWPDYWNSTDVRSWVRICTGQTPEHLREIVDEEHEWGWESIPFMYVHKDEHITDTRTETDPDCSHNGDGEDV